MQADINPTGTGLTLQEERIYQRIGEFVVSFQWLENRLREIGWFILDPERKEWPPKPLRKETTAELIDKVERLFLQAVPECRLGNELESDLRDGFVAGSKRFHELRRLRNRILHSAYIELKAGGEVIDLLRSNPKLGRDPETGEALWDREYLSGQSFDAEMKQMAELAFFLNRCYTQLIHRYPDGGQSSNG